MTAAQANTATEVSTTEPAMVKWSRVKGKKKMTKELKTHKLCEWDE